MPRLLFVHTGGTVMMAPAGTGALKPDTYGRDLVSELPPLARIAEIDARILYNLDSGDLQPEHWVTIAQEVHAAIASNVYDGIVVLHGTDTMAYTASAVALLLGSVPRPVVFTGAQRPLVEARTDARENVVDAALLATLDVPEVVVAFASKGFRGVRSTKRDAWALEAFDSPNCPPLVTLGLGIDFGSHVRAPAELGAFDGRIERRVLAVRVFPGLDPALLRGALDVGVRGIVLEAYGTGNLPHLDGSLIPVIAEATRRSVPVLIVSQCLRGVVDLGRYGGAAEARRAGALSGGDMTVEAALAKLMIGLGRYGTSERLVQYLERDAVGERS